MPPRPWANALDMYRKVPADLLEGTRRGSVLSYLCLFTMALLFYLETRDFLSSRMVTDLALDSNRDPKVRVNFNITMMDLRCSYATVDVVSVLGTEQNVTAHVLKFAVDAEGVRNLLVGTNKKQAYSDIDLRDEGVTETIEELHENGEDAVSLDKTTLEFARHQYEFLLVDFYAGWCSHCRDLAPTWEVLAEVMMDAAEEKLDAKIEGREHEYNSEDYREAAKLELPVFVAKVDCVDHAELCVDQGIMGYPTIRLFHNGEHKSDYHGHRSVVEMTHWLANLEDKLHPHRSEDEKKINSADEIARERMGVSASRDEMGETPKRPERSATGDSPEEREWAEQMKRHRSRQIAEWRDEDHPGCMLSGFLMVDRAPGHFHIQARSRNHDIAAHMTNVSHEVHHLSFGDLGSVFEIEEAEAKMARSDVVFPPSLIEATHPMDGNAYITRNVHEAHHHYLKVITNDFDGPTRRAIRKIISSGRIYTMIQSTQLSIFRNDIVPEAKFTYDLSPISVSYRLKTRRWYDYMTSLMAIVGGTFTVMGLLDNCFSAVSGGGRGRRK